MQCPECGAEIQEDAKFCPSCGTRIEYAKEIAEGQKRLCPNCGAELSRDDIFCGSCGTKIDEFGAVKTEKPMEIKRRPTGVTIIAILVLGLGGIVGLITGFDLMVRGYYESIRLIGQILFIIGFVDLLIGYGLWTLKRWARMAAIIMAIIGTVGNIIGELYMLVDLLMPFVSAIIGSVIIGGIIIWYLSRPEIREVFEG